ncbi:MAG: hypothetical protein ACRDZO_20920 [Egibacteraceae bacterium]
MNGRDSIPEPTDLIGRLTRFLAGPEISAAAVADVVADHVAGGGHLTGRGLADAVSDRLRVGPRMAMRILEGFAAGQLDGQQAVAR